MMDSPACAALGRHNREWLLQLLRASQSSHKQTVLSRDWHVELLDCQSIRLALIGSLYRSEAIHLFAAKNDNRPSARRAR
jgi:hypothetical protein